MRIWRPILKKARFIPIPKTLKPPGAPLSTGLPNRNTLFLAASIEIPPQVSRITNSFSDVLSSTEHPSRVRCAPPLVRSFMTSAPVLATAWSTALSIKSRMQSVSPRSRVIMSMKKALLGWATTVLSVSGMGAPLPLSSPRLKKPLMHDRAVLPLPIRSDEKHPSLSGCQQRRAGTRERIYQQTTRAATNGYSPARNLDGQFICGAALVLPMPHRTQIVPNIAEVNSLHYEPLVPAIVSHIRLALGAPQGLNLWPTEDSRLPLCEVQQRVVSWVQPTASGEPVLHGDGDPVSELEQVSKHAGEPD